MLISTKNSEVLVSSSYVRQLVKAPSVAISTIWQSWLNELGSFLCPVVSTTALLVVFIILLWTISIDIYVMLGIQIKSLNRNQERKDTKLHIKIGWKSIGAPYPLSQMRHTWFHGTSRVSKRLGYEDICNQKRNDKLLWWLQPNHSATPFFKSQTRRTVIDRHAIFMRNKKTKKKKKDKQTWVNK